MVNLNKAETQIIINLLKKDGEEKNQKLISRLERSIKQIKPRSAKNKGMEWQKEVCEIIGRLTNIQYIQADDCCEIHSRESGLNGVDIILRGKAKERFPYCVECKNSKKLSVPEWVKQAESNSDRETNWLLAVKSPMLSCKKVVIMPMGEFEKLYERIEKDY